jgi:hypothetical protein
LGRSYWPVYLELRDKCRFRLIQLILASIPIVIPGTIIHIIIPYIIVIITRIPTHPILVATIIPSIMATTPTHAATHIIIHTATAPHAGIIITMIGTIIGAAK